LLRFAQKQALNYTIFVNIQKRPKGQMAKPFYFWQTVSKKAKFGIFGLFKGQMATLICYVLVVKASPIFKQT